MAKGARYIVVSYIGNAPEGESDYQVHTSGYVRRGFAEHKRRQLALAHDGRTYRVFDVEDREFVGPELDEARHWINDPEARGH